MHAAARKFDPDKDEHPVKYLVEKIANPCLYPALHSWLKDDVGVTADDPTQVHVPAAQAEW